MSADDPLHDYVDNAGRRVTIGRDLDAFIARLAERTDHVVADDVRGKLEAVDTLDEVQSILERELAGLGLDHDPFVTLDRLAKLEGDAPEDS